jgi:hypothetical protein
LQGESVHTILCPYGGGKMRELDAEIARADAALDAGNAVEAARLAQSTLALSGKKNNVLAEAKSLACLAKCDRILSRFRRSRYAGKRAAELFAAVGEVAGQADALGTLAHAASALGHDEEAVDAALRGVQLAETIGSHRPVAVAKIQLSVAYLFGGSYERAHSALDDAIYLSKLCNPVFSPFQARLTQGCVEVRRGIVERCLGQEPSGGGRFREVLSVANALFETGNADTTATGVGASARALWFLVSSAGHIWSGDLEQADAELVLASDCIRGFGVVTSLDALAELVRTERAFAVADWKAAERHSLAAIKLGTQAEHEQFAMLGQMAAGRVLEAQGKHSDALRMARALTVRQLKIRVEGLDGRTASAGRTGGCVLN